MLIFQPPKAVPYMNKNNYVWEMQFKREVSIYKSTLFLCLLLSLRSYGASSDSLYSVTPPYEAIVSAYHRLDSLYPQARLIPYGKTDVGLPLQLFIIDKKEFFDPGKLHDSGNVIVFINNGIHPGEPDGINASLLWAEQLLKDITTNPQLNRVTICILPVFNIDGALERSCCSRVNQNGPPEYGFRGNAQNLDLNRDFIKCDARNTQSWIKIFRKWDPDIFVDTHVSDGADYQYTMTLISSQADKLYPVLGSFMRTVIEPDLYKMMKNRGEEMCPYVNTMDYETVPDSGISDFLELPRFASGYAALFSSIPFIAETHMLKPFGDRVKATLKLFSAFLELSNSHIDGIIKVRAESKQDCITRTIFPVGWKLDTSQWENLSFKGFRALDKISRVTGGSVVQYDHSQPYQKDIRNYRHYLATDTVNAPMFYLIPQAWYKVITLLDQNNIRLIAIHQDSVTLAEVSYIDSFQTTAHSYEGHYLHYDTKIRRQIEKVQVRKGDYLVPVFQEGSRLVVETLEPEAEDSYFNWGFFDSILQQKEWFSSYVFDEMAEKILSDNPELKTRLETRKAADPAFARDAFAQLYFVYANSIYFEKSLNRYPVYRIGHR